MNSVSNKNMATNSKRVLLVGGNGFIGSHLADVLLATGYRVRILDLRHELFRPPLEGVEYVLGSFADEAVVRRALSDCDILVHLAHSTVPENSLNNPNQELFDSVGPFIKLLGWLHDSPIERIVYISSGGAVYGDTKDAAISEDALLQPISPYGVAKLAMEKYLHMFCRLYDKKYIVVRPSNPFGPRQNFKGAQGVIAIFMYRILTGQVISIWGDDSIAKDYIYIGDMARSIVSLINAGFDNGVYNIGSAHPMNLRSIVRQLEHVTGMQAQCEHAEGHKSDVQHIALDTQRFRERTGSDPVTLRFDEGLKRTYQWMLGMLKP
jgi:UDP-glucose 4-epimerase